ncbi:MULTISPECIES: UvrD-helicase domain-containing protein [unclassified Rhodococcus (in: high G+C Gram-positive bacteria)]|uniref:UvrD-helicase domain-containing protein n=1 Tax=unclassified Rhodococcus (in: high G+C Gram-positive bacteria) TaxID=192944 RepID=UPI003398E1EA
MTARADAPDTDADRQIREILDRDQLIGFTVVAGAGSGKTTSLVKALAHITRTRGPSLLAKTQRVACITYTEVAAREIHEEIGNDRLASVSTIHSFLWALAKPFQKDIGVWVAARIDEQIAGLLEKQASYKPSTRQTTKDNDAADLEKRRHQQAAMKDVKRWAYGIGADYARGIVGHTDVTKMVPEMILRRRLLAQLVGRQFPFIFVDESQDTYPEVVEALKHVWSLAGGNVCLGFFGDPMQQIYQQGVVSVSLEPGWVNVDKPQNFRSSRRVLACVNAIRSEGDSLQQVSGLSEQAEGEAFCFVLPSDDQRSDRLELVRSWLDEHSTSGNWTRSAHKGGSKILMIVHRMAAKRLGFGNLYAAFNDRKASSLGQAFDEGNAWPLTPFRDVILPLCLAKDVSSPAVLAVLRESSPLVRAGQASRQLKAVLASSKAAVGELRQLALDSSTAKLGDLLRSASSTELIELDPRMAAYLHLEGEHGDVVLDERVVDVLNAMSECVLSELEGYYTYVKQESPYSTQHGTKGSEFERVIVVLDDNEGRFSLYSYDKFLGLKELSATDLDNQSRGADSAIERTRRLFYVCVSRARESVAVVLFSNDVARAVEAVRESAIGQHVQVLTVDDLSPLT